MNRHPMAFCACRWVCTFGLAWSVFLSAPAETLAQVPTSEVDTLDILDASAAPGEEFDVLLYMRHGDPLIEYCQACN